MSINCNIAADLLPLYADGSCSADSRAALEEHLKDCPACHAALDRMQSGITSAVHAEPSAPKLADYAKKVRRHRARVVVSVVLVTILAAAVLALGGLAIQDMYREANPHTHGAEPGTWDLTANELETTAEEVGQYVFYTNYKQIEVTVQDSGSGTVMLWNAGDDRTFIQIHDVSGTPDSCTFTGLSAANRYRITCDGLDGASIAVSEGRTVSFWRSLQNVLSGIFVR